MRQIGMLLSMAIVMLILARHLGHADVSTQNQDAFMQAARIAFAIFGVMCFAGIFASLARGRLNRDGP